MNFTDNVKYIKNKFWQADYPLHFVDSIITKFQSSILFIIPPSLFDEHKPFILKDNLFCKKDKNKSKDFIKNSPALQ